MGRQIQFNFQNFVNKTAVQVGKLFVTQSKLKNKKFLETDDLHFQKKMNLILGVALTDTVPK